MMELKPFDIKLLQHLSNCSDGANSDELELSFGKECDNALEELESKDLTSRRYSDNDFKNIPAGFMPSPTGNWEITDLGKLFLKRHDSVKILKTKEIWSNRAWGFIVGVATVLTVSYILFVLGWS